MDTGESLMEGIQGRVEERAKGNGGVMKFVRVTLITVLLVLSGASSMMSFYATGQAMASYPVFLLYFCNGIYGVGYFLALTIVYTKFSGGGGPGGTDSPLMGSYEGAKSALGGVSMASARF
jgi:hypothetical protein